MTYAKKLIVPTLCVLLGCAGGAAMGNVTAQTWPESPSAPRWQQECAAVSVRPDILPNANTLLQQRGNEGWEYVGTVGQYGSIMCFKRPAP